MAHIFGRRHYKFVAEIKAVRKIIRGFVIKLCIEFSVECSGI